MRYFLCENLEPYIYSGWVLQQAVRQNHGKYICDQPSMFNSHILHALTKIAVAKFNNNYKLVSIFNCFTYIIFVVLQETVPELCL